MALKLPLIIGHRGAAAYAPENTLESIRTAADMGVAWVELDVKLTKDQVPIIFHDEDLDRTTNGSGPVMLRTYEEISQLEAGSWFADSFAGIKIPTLEEAAELIMELGLGLNLEIKPCPGRERETAEVALDHLSRMWEDHDKLLISSFSHVSLEAARDMANDWKRGLLIDDPMPPNWRDLADYLGAASINIGDKFTTRELVEEIMDEDYAIAVWTVNDPQRARQLQQWGVDSIFTDMPDILEESLLKVH
jgi:glycerophosphoryl diester phosphodiesterase